MAATFGVTSKNASQSLPKLTNTPGLYDGSAEARAIINNASEVIDNELEGGGSDTVVADGILYHVMEYLKGKDMPLMGMWTREFWGDEYTEDLTADEFAAIQNMVMDRSAVVETEGQQLVQIEGSNEDCNKS